MKFGIVGYGRFGKLWANALMPFGEVFVYDKNNLQINDELAINLCTLKKVAETDFVFLLVPISEFEQCCKEIKTLLHPDTAIVDCCSVKVYSVNVMRKVFSNNQLIIATHPLFGPDSVKKSGGLTGHKIVLCPTQSDKENYLKKLFTDMGLKILLSTPEEHDKQMATSQGLVHFIGRGLSALDLSQQELSTPDFQALLNINSMVVNDKRQLFLDMHKFNPYAKEIRQKFIRELMSIDHEIGGGMSDVDY